MGEAPTACCVGASPMEPLPCPARQCPAAPRRARLCLAEPCPAVRGCSGLEPERLPATLVVPLPRQAQPRQALPCPAQPGCACGSGARTQTPASTAYGTRALPRIAKQRPALPGIAVPSPAAPCVGSAGIEPAVRPSPPTNPCQPASRGNRDEDTPRHAARRSQARQRPIDGMRAKRYVQYRHASRHVMTRLVVRPLWSLPGQVLSGPRVPRMPCRPPRHTFQQPAHHQPRRRPVPRRIHPHRTRHPPPHRARPPQHVLRAEPIPPTPARQPAGLHQPIRGGPDRPGVAASRGPGHGPDACPADALQPAHTSRYRPPR